MKNAKKGLGDL